MGCCGSKHDEEAIPGMRRALSIGELKSDGPGHSLALERLKQMDMLDATTTVPFVLVELRGEANQDGVVEVCGKDEFGVHAALEKFLVNEWDCSLHSSYDTDVEKGVIPFSAKSYKWSGFLVDEGCSSGTTNMGLKTMHLVDFMCNKLSWTLGVINGGNLGQKGEIREQQITFKAPHPMNLQVPHVMVELRSAGFIEICGMPPRDLVEELDNYFKREFKGRKKGGKSKFCDRFYECADGVFKERDNGDNNLGLLTVKIIDRFCIDRPWSLVTMNGGNYGETGRHREQQLVFRRDNHPLGANEHFMVELRGTGYIEVNGEPSDDRGSIYSELDEWFTSKEDWGCRVVEGEDEFCHKKFSWKPQDMLDATADLTGFFHERGWQLLICSQGTVKVEGEDDSREQQIIFRPAEESGYGVIEPHLLVDLYMGEGDDELFQQSDKTQVLGEQKIRVRSVGDCGNVLDSLHAFATESLSCQVDEENNTYLCDIFMTRGMYENNLGMWTMRICDFMVDHQEWSFVVCNICNLGEFGQLREQQLIFRYDGPKRKIPATKESELFDASRREQYSSFTGPDYWINESVKRGDVLQENVPCGEDECRALQQIMDSSFRRVLTRDRQFEEEEDMPDHLEDEMPYRLELVHAFRSENVPLMYRYMERRETYDGGTPFEPRTSVEGNMLTMRLKDGEALLFHGTNPSAAVNILKGGFLLSKSGSNVGTMFGHGIYMAECCSKSDEYAKDDGGGIYPGLRCLVVCRSHVGKPHIVYEKWNPGLPTSPIDDAKAKGCDCVLGDREKKVGTYKELVFYDEAQVMPEYAVIYKRQYDKEQVPEFLNVPATGTTGRNWEVMVGGRWLSVPPRINRLLRTAEEGTIVKGVINKIEYEFDPVNMKQKNMKSGRERDLRKPRVLR